MNEDKDKVETKKLPKNLVALGFVSALNDLASEIAIRTIPLFLANVLGVKIGLIGLIEGIAETTATLLKLGSGIWSDRIGKRKPLALLGFGLSNFTKPLLYFAGSWQWVMVLRFVDRAGKGIRSTPCDALIADSVKKEDRGRAFGFNRSMDPIGAIAGLLVAAGLVYFSQGEKTQLSENVFRTLILIATVPALLSVAILAFIVKEPEGRAKLQKKFSFKGTLSPGLWRFLIALFVFNLSATSDAFLVLRSQEIGLPLWGTFLLIALMNLILSVVSFPTGILSDRIGRRGILAGGWLLFALQLLGFAYASNAIHLVGLFVLYGVYLGMTEGVEKALLTDLAPEEFRGTAFGYFYLAIGVAAFPASLITGIIWQTAGSQAAFLVGSALALAGAILLVLVPPNQVLQNEK